jgi:hypothetical protein
VLIEKNRVQKVEEYMSKMELYVLQILQRINQKKQNNVDTTACNVRSCSGAGKEEATATAKP